MTDINTALRVWLWHDGDHWLAYDSEFPKLPNGDPATVGEPEYGPLTLNAARAQSPAPSDTAAWQTVPVETTEEMEFAGNVAADALISREAAYDASLSTAVYNAMLAAAPKPTTPSHDALKAERDALATAEDYARAVESIHMSWNHASPEYRQGFQRGLEIAAQAIRACNLAAAQGQEGEG